jgi:prepilin-type processing-associated H-X9-DG protein
MIERKQRGFMVAEVLLVAAIIGLLAGMLVPLFETARDRARTTTCMANQQQIVSAIRMYMSDHDDTLPPDEHCPEVLAYFDTCPGGRSYPSSFDHCHRARQANPYLRWPVVFDPYLADRAVWQCPSARLTGGATWIVPGPDWLGYLRSTEGMWGSRHWSAGGPCYHGWPTGWGGDITDSIAQQQLAGVRWGITAGDWPEGVFAQSLATPWHPDLRLAEVTDPGQYVITSDGGAVTQDLSVGTMAYPDICCLECSGVCSWVDWEICTWGADCGIYQIAPNDRSFVRHVSLRLPYARHRARFAIGVPGWVRSGVNVGFLDGHVEWLPSETVIARARDGQIEGVEPWGPTTYDESRPWWECFPGSITLY